MKKKLIISLFTIALSCVFRLTAMDVPSKRAIAGEAAPQEQPTRELFKIVGAKKIGAGALEAVENLIDSGADVNATGKKRITPLHLAALMGHTELCSLLIERGAKINAENDGGDTPLSYAARYGHAQTVALLSERGANLEAKNKYGNTALSYAARNGHTQTVKLLLERGANLEVKNMAGLSPLMLAAMRGHLQTVALLLESGANLEARDGKHNTPLMFAARYGRPRTVALLLERGASVNAKNELRLTPLHYAVISGNPQTVELLLAGGANFKAKNTAGFTPLMWAAGSEKTGVGEICRLLLRYMLIQPIMNCGKLAGDVRLPEDIAECRARLAAVLATLKRKRVSQDMQSFIIHNSPQLEKELLFVFYDYYMRGEKITGWDKVFLMNRLPQVVSSKENLDAVRSAMRKAFARVDEGGEFTTEKRAMLNPDTLVQRLPEILFGPPR